MATQSQTEGPAPGVQPGLETAVRVARFMSHLFLGLSLFSVFVCVGARSVLPLLICGGGFLLSYFAWVALVLFGCMNFALSAMLWFVLGLGACLGLLMSGEGGLMAIGGLGLLILLFATVIPVSDHDPTTPAAKRAKGKTATVFFVALPLIFLALLMLGESCAIAGLAGMLLLTIGVMIPYGPHGSKEWRESEWKGR